MQFLSPPPTAQSLNVPVINGLRAIAILGVIWHHLFFHLLVPPMGSAMDGFGLIALSILTSGWMGVNLFFFLSGFVLFLPYATGRRSFNTEADSRSYLYRRAVRLLPLFYLSLLTGIALSDIDRSTLSFMFVLPLTLALLFPLFPFSFFPIGNWVLWSLGVEIFFSIAFPAIARTMQRFAIWKVVFVAASVGLATRIVGELYFRAPYPTQLNFISDGLLGRIDDFALGMACASLYALQRLPRHALTFPAGLLLILLSTTLSLQWILQVLPPWSLAVAHTLFNVGVFLAVSHLVNSRGFVARILELKPVQVVGMMCFSLYVWHGIILLKIYPHHGSNSAIEILSRLPQYLIVTFSIAAVSYRFIEFPKQSVRDLFLAKAKASI